MLNSEKFKTANERAKAFTDFCDARTCDKCEMKELPEEYTTDCCLAFWLELEAEEEKPLPCPFCGGNVIIEDTSTNSVNDGWCVECPKDDCMYSSGIKRTRDEAISAHNRVAKAAMAAKESEVGNV